MSENKIDTKEAQKIMSEIRQTFAEFDKEASHFLANGVIAAAKRSRSYVTPLQSLLKQFRKASIDACK